MQTNQTPFQYIQRRGRQRKNSILSTIEKKDLKRRSISYNFKAKNSHNYENVQQDETIENKEHYTHIAINNSIKKAYYYRKLMNKSIDSHLTNDQFQRVKEKFDKVNTRESQNNNKTTLFREIWEKEHVKKYAMVSNNDQQNYLEVIAKNSEKSKTSSLETDSCLKKKEETHKIILDIAVQRRTSLNFDLEILGNKKSIRIKDNHHKLKINTLDNAKTLSEEEKEQKHTKEQSNCSEKNISPSIKIECQKDQQQVSKTACSFFKRFQQQNSQQNNDKQHEFLMISKISQRPFPAGNNYELQKIRLKKLILKDYHSHKEESQFSTIKKEILNSWRPVTRVSGKSQQFEASSLERRTSIENKRKTQIPSFTNDINGWLVQQQNDDEIISTFQK